MISVNYVSELGEKKNGSFFVFGFFFSCDKKNNYFFLFFSDKESSFCTYSFWRRSRLLGKKSFYFDCLLFLFSYWRFFLIFLLAILTLTSDYEKKPNNELVSIFHCFGQKTNSFSISKITKIANKKIEKKENKIKEVDQVQFLESIFKETDPNSCALVPLKSYFRGGVFPSGLFLFIPFFVSCSCFLVR